MSVQINCFFCGKLSLVCSSGVRIEQIDENGRKLEIECLHCGAINREIIFPVNGRGKVLSPIDFAGTQEECQEKQLDFDFDVGSTDTESPHDILDESGTLISEPVCY